MGEIWVKRVYEPAGPADGLRVLVDRVWPRGRTREQVACPVWAKEMTPSTGLRKAFHSGAVDGEEFERLYREELAGAPALADLAEQVGAAIKDGDVTLVTAAHLVPHGHAEVLRAVLREGLGPDCLDTGRVRLQPVRLEDLDELFAMTRMPEVNRFNPAGPDRDLSQARESLEQWMRDWETDGIGYYTAREPATGAYIGYMGLAARALAGERVLNLAYRIRPEFQGAGLVTEACRAIIEAARPRWSGYRVRALTKQDNKPSIAVATRLGLSHDPGLDGRPDPGDVSYFLHL